MRVAIDVRAAQYSRVGVGVYVLHLVDALVDRFPDVTFDLLATPGLADPTFHRQAKNATLRRVAPGYHQHFRRDWWEQMQLPSLLRALQADVYHAPNYILPVLGRSSAATVATFHDAYAFLPSPSYDSISSRRVRGLVRATARRADRIIFDSRFTKNEFEEQIGNWVTAKGVVIYLGPPPLPIAAGRSDAPNRRGQRPYIVTVGSIHPRKNYRRLVSAMATQLLGDLDLVIVGRGEGLADLRAYASTLGVGERVHVAGYVSTPDLVELVRDARLMVFPSLYEGFALPVLEALQMNIPICVSDNGCFREIADTAAMYFDPLSVEGMAACIRTVADDNALRDRLTANGANVLARFSWVDCAEEHMNAYVAATLAFAGRRKSSTL
jgi:glycosyltransferase involved in cell wall biosynthesis